MKKVAFIIIIGTFLSSCKEACYECTLAGFPVPVTVDVCEGTATVYQNGQIVSTDNIPAGISNKQYVEDLENSYTSYRYTCSKK